MQLFIDKEFNLNYNGTMQIIMGKETADQIGEKYIVLELDTVKIKGKLVPAFAVLDAGSIPLGEMQEIPIWVEHHNKVMENYYKQNWKFCEQMVEHCQGRWGGSMDSFYTEMLNRIKILKMKKPPKDWDGVIIK